MTPSRSQTAIGHREQMVTEREQAVKVRESAVTTREDAVAAREREDQALGARLREQEAKLVERERRREDAVEKREDSVRERELALEKRLSAMGGTTADHTSAAHCSKKAGKKDAMDMNTMHDVTKLVSDYSVTGGVLPLGLMVAEVESLQQAATKAQSAANNCDLQIDQLAERGKLTLPSDARRRMEMSQERLRIAKDEALGSVRSMLQSYDKLRNKSIERFVPLLLKTVDKFNTQFNDT